MKVRHKSARGSRSEHQRSSETTESPMPIKHTTHFVPFPDGEQPRTLPPVSSMGEAIVGNPYRGGEDGIWLQTFSEHLSIAFGLAEELVATVPRFEHLVRIGVAEGLESVARQIGRSWEMLWSQLDDARSLATRRGRDVSTYDRARVNAKDLSSGAAQVEIGEWLDAGLNAKERTVQYRIPRLEPALDAMEALKLSVPEAQIVRQPEAPDLRSARRGPWKWILIAIVVALGVAVASFEWNLLHSR